MADYITLMGAEQVQSAASSLSRSAEKMQSAASVISDAMHQQQLFLDDWLFRYRQMLEEIDHAKRE